MDELLEKTKGIWTHGDGLDYQQMIRDEWETSDKTVSYHSQDGKDDLST